MAGAGDRHQPRHTVEALGIFLMSASIAATAWSFGSPATLGPDTPAGFDADDRQTEGRQPMIEHRRHAAGLEYDAPTGGAFASEAAIASGVDAVSRS